MTATLITIDTEPSIAAQKRGEPAAENLASAIFGRTAEGAYGIGYQIERLNAYGLKAVFFVEALHSLVFGLDTLKRIVEPILQGAHEVQLHLHVEWLRWTEGPLHTATPLWRMADADYGAQRTYIEAGLDLLERAGAPRPNAFRAGGYAANNDTLRALAACGVTYDSSYNQPMVGRSCQIEANPTPTGPTPINGVIEVPVTSFEPALGSPRWIQVNSCAIAEFEQLSREARRVGQPTMVIVSHSFELLNRMRTRPNRMVVRRFERMCAHLAEHRTELPCVGFHNLDVSFAPGRELKSGFLPSARRAAEQVLGNLLYERA